jgi:hypothetical protein
MGERLQRAGKRADAAWIAAAAVVALGLSVHHEVQLTAAALTPGQITSQTAAYRQEECLYRAIRSQVPKGAAVYITSPPAAPPTERLSELSTLWADLKANRAAARWTLTLVSARGHCDGEALEVRRI